VIAITTIGLGPPLRSSERSSVGGLGEMRRQSRPREFFSHEAPSSGGLQRKVGIEALEGGEELPDSLPQCRDDAASSDFARFCVQPLERDLLPMHVECAGTRSIARDDTPTDLVLKDRNTTIATWVHNEGVGTVQNQMDQSRQRPRIWISQRTPPSRGRRGHLPRSVDRTVCRSVSPRQNG
jgi:hypothetical protein